MICDESGDVVALSHHVTFVPGAERYLSARRKLTGKHSKLWSSLVDSHVVFFGAQQLPCHYMRI